jgi:hypothetical protein
MLKFTVSVSRIMSRRAAAMSRARSRWESVLRRGRLLSGGVRREEVKKREVVRGRVVAVRVAMGRSKDVRSVGRSLEWQ